FLSDASRWRICAIGRALTWGLRPFARRPALGATPRAIAARVASAVGLPAPVEGKGLVTGGRVLALVGGDGAGKTTCATELTAWLGRELATLRVHLGRPPRSLATLAVGCALGLARLLRRVEWTYYEWMRPPDATIVLQLDPELAVSRKTDEPEDYVRERAQIVWHTDWAGVDGVYIVDAGRALPEVLSDLKSLVWSLI